MLFDFVTVKEHLEFYSGLKEVPVEQRENAVTCLIIVLLCERKTLLTGRYIDPTLTEILYAL